MTVSSLAKGTQQSPHAIAEIMKFQNKSFIAVAGKVAAIHEEIEKLKELYAGSYGNKTIKLTGTLNAGMCAINHCISILKSYYSKQHCRLCQKGTVSA